MARQVGKTLQVTLPRVVPKVKTDVNSEAVQESVPLNLDDIDPQAGPEGRLRIDLDLDQLEDSDE